MRQERRVIQFLDHNDVEVGSRWRSLDNPERVITISGREGACFAATSTTGRSTLIRLNTLTYNYIRYTPGELPTKPPCSHAEKLAAVTAKISAVTEKIAEVRLQYNMATGHLRELATLLRELSAAAPTESPQSLMFSETPGGQP